MSGEKFFTAGTNQNLKRPKNGSWFSFRSFSPFEQISGDKVSLFTA